MKKYFLISVIIFFATESFAQRATWIWYPGDYEIWLGNKMQNRRTERGTFFPPFWKMDAHFVLVDFHKDFNLSAPEEIKIFTEGSYNLKLDSKMIEGTPGAIQLPAGKHLETMALCAEIMSDAKNASTYKKLATDLKSKLFALYWNPAKQALVHSRIDGKPTENVTRYANMFAIFFNYLTETQKQGVKKNVLLNDKVPKITTPYMRFYELEALCAMKEQDYVLKEMKEYWGGMLKLGATSFWEKYDPAESSAAHYAMYGRPFGKSLCHAWGASPLYLLGKYYLGVRPTGPGYSTYTVEPVLGGLEWMEGSVPMPSGEIKLRCSKQEIRITTTTGKGSLRFTSKTKPVCEGAVIRATGNNGYEMTIEKGKEYIVSYNL